MILAEITVDSIIAPMTLTPVVDTTERWQMIARMGKQNTFMHGFVEVLC